ncbi:PilZ domain-containing protein [Alishewanella sp. d11]|uniref:PilZ domain-containing protein n=1 Tax=Alishewanella sp. d11 TaxID=3414030 RepID=UPI003BF7898C
MPEVSPLFYEEVPTVSGNNKDWLNHIKIGQRFDLEFLSQRKYRGFCELLGYKAGKYVFFRLEDDAIPEAFLVAGLPLVCRFLVEDALGECFAFRSELMHFMRFPDKVIMIAFPQTVQRRALRNEKRASTFIPAKLQLHFEKATQAVLVPGQIIDLSKNGCRFLFNTQYKPEQIRLAEVVIQLANPDTAADMLLSGIIRNARLDEFGLTAGIQFNAEQIALVKALALQAKNKSTAPR